MSINPLRPFEVTIDFEIKSTSNTSVGCYYFITSGGLSGFY